MKLTPLDIQQQQFRTAMLGFDKKEVDAFLDAISTDVEGLLRDNNALREEIKRKDADLLEHKAREQTLKDTLVTATRITEDIKVNARKESEIVIAQAEQQAEQIIQNAHTRLVRIMEDIDELRRQKAQFQSSLRSVISTHEKLLHAVEQSEGAEASMHSLVSRRAQPRADTMPAGEDRPNLSEDLLVPRGGDR